MFTGKLSTVGLLVIGFLIMAGISVVLNFKQARVVDAMGDVAKVNAEIRGLRMEAQEEGVDKDKRKKIEEELKELQEEDLPEQRHDAMQAMASMPNGAVMWTFLSQIGAGLFGLGVLSIFLKNEEHPVVRSTALLVSSGMVLTFVAARFVYLIIGGGSGMGAAF